MVKILLNGATAGTNFGDYLFAQMFQDYLSNKLGKENVVWYSSRFVLSNFYREHLNNYREYRLNEIDGLVYISGGYFCGNDKCIRDFVFRFFRYFLIGLHCCCRRIPFAIIGVEVGVSKSKLIQWIQAYLIKKAEMVVVRNQQSYKIASMYRSEKLFCTADTVFAMNKEFFDSKAIPEEIKNCNRKLIFMHVHPVRGQNEQVIKKVIPVLNRFLMNHSEYGVVIAADQYAEDQETMLHSIAKLIQSDVVIPYVYNDPVALCKVIETVNVVVTTKLHVGIVGARLGKSVISFSGHTEKIARLYEQLGESGRSVSLSSLDENQGVMMLEKYHELPIIVPERIKELANMNFAYLDYFIENITCVRDAK